MKLLHVYKACKPYSYGGIETIIDSLASEGVRQGDEVVILSLSNSILNDKIFINNGVKIHVLKTDFEIFSNTISLKYFFTVRKYIKWCDIVNMHYPWPFFDLIYLLLNYKKKLVIIYHSDIVRQKLLEYIYSPIRFLFFKRANKIVVTSPNYLNTSNFLIYYSHKITVIPLGLNRNQYLVDAKKYEYWKSKIGENYFLFVGALRYYKGLFYLIKSIKDAPYNLVIVGSGKMFTALKRISKGSKNILFIGSVEDADKNAIYALSYSVVFPSNLRAEAFGVSLLEGAIFSKSLISCEIGSGTSYANLNSETGIVVEPSSSISLRKAMDTLWYDNQLNKKYGYNANLRFNKLFTIEKIYQKYKKLYIEILTT
jgi:rhamnosyl/mannosyltransferase